MGGAAELARYIDSRLAGAEPPAPGVLAVEVPVIAGADENGAVLMLAPKPGVAPTPPAIDASEVARPRPSPRSPSWR